MKSSDLLQVARDLVAAAEGRPRQVNLKRAISSAYYAMFHALAKTAADGFLGGPGSDRSEPAWLQTYRALEHGVAKTACKNKGMIAKFPQEIQEFAEQFAVMQLKRHRADYAPDEVVYKPQVSRTIDYIETVISRFEGASLKDRRAFAVYVLFKLRTDRN